MTDRIKSAREFEQLIERKCRELHARASFIADQIAAGDDTTFAVAMLKDSASGVSFRVAELVELAEGEANHG
jgi:hypothetical protein